jgi:HK97 family phage major capsid protein
MTISRKQLISAMRNEGWNGEGGLDGLKSFATENGIEIQASGKVIDLDAAWSKTVTISISKDDEEVVVQETSASMYGSDDDEKSVDEDEDEDQKSRRPSARDVHKALGGGRAPSVHGEQSYAAKRKRYEADYRAGKAVHSCPESAEFWGAYFRSQIMGSKSYPFKGEDQAILKAAHVTSDNALGGALVPDGFIATLIENKTQFGAAGRIASITPMALPKETMPRLVNDVVMNYTSEAAASGETNLTFDTVDLVTHEISGHAPISLRLLNGSAINVSDALSRSFNRAIGFREDTAYFLGDSKQQGIIPQLGANSYVAVSSLNTSQLGGILIADIQRLIGRVPSWAASDGSDLAFTMTRQVYEQTLGRFEMNAPGNTRANLREGPSEFPGADRVWGGYPVYFNEVMQKGYSNGTIPILFGAFRRATKMGLWNGSVFMRSSEHVGFLNRTIVVQAGEEFAVNPHDVNNLAGESGDPTRSGVVGLQVNN